MSKRKKSISPFASIINWFRNLNPETKKGIWIIFLFAISLILILGFFGLAGSLGQFTSGILKLFLGWAAIIFPLLIIIIAIILIKENFSDSDYKGSNYFGAALFILSLTGIMHLKFISQDMTLEAIQASQGGGYMGILLGYPLFRLTGFWASLILLIALIATSLLLMFNASIYSLLKPGQLLIKIFSPITNIFSLSANTILKNKKSDEESLNSQTIDMSEEYNDNKEEEEDDEDDDEDEKEEEEEDSLLDIAPAKKKLPKIHIDIPLHFLNKDIGKPNSGDIKANQFKIKKTLENFNIPVDMGETKTGPTVTQYTLKPADGVKLSKLTNLSNDLALALAAHPIRIEAPIPGKSLVGIEVPNQSTSIVGLREILNSPDFKSRKTDLMLSLGKDVAGRCWLANLAKMPHMLVAGSTGSGKSVCLNSIIISLLYQNSPDDLKFILIDPKRVEFPVYNGIPHLLAPVITDVKKTVNALKWAIGEMDKRFELLSKSSKRDIHAYNNYADERLPFIVIIIDELADLMSVAGADVESTIVRLAQMSRAVGIHLIVATQRPSVDVITGLIKANITSRIAFSVASQTDSRTILDMSGAEKLLGRGDMLFISAELSKPKRLQGALVTEKEIDKIVKYLKEQAEPQYNEDVTEKNKLGGGVVFGNNNEDDELLPEAKIVIVKADKASASLLQRKLKIGYSRAARILDILEDQGIIGPADGAKPRKILISTIDGDIIEPEDNEENEEKNL